MKITKSFEEAIYVICILALQKDKTPVKSYVLSDILQVSDSYLKKILQKLVRANLITSNASKIGGFQLKKSVYDLSLLDIFNALGLHEDVVDYRHLSRHVFDDEKHVRNGEEKILQTFQKGLDSFYGVLNQFTISELLQEEFIENGWKDWNVK